MNIDERLEELAREKMLPESEVLAQALLRARQALAAVPCSHTHEWYGQRSHFECGKCDNCKALADTELEEAL